jgi:hypothetical protein
MVRALLLLFVPAFAAALDLSRATVIAPASLGPTERQAVIMLVEEAEKRSQIRWPTAREPGGSGPAILIRNAAKGAREGYTLRVETGAVHIEGNDARGVLFGIGHFLRILRCSRARVEAPDGFRATTAPKVALRGHQLGYRPKTNSYDGWTLGQWEQYIRDLAVFGTNAVELIPPRSDDAADSPHFPLSQIETMIGMSHLLDQYGLDVWIWYPALDPDYSKAETVEFALKEWAEVFRKLPRIDAVFVPGGDPGHTPPKVLMPFLEKQAASLRKYHAKAQMWVAPQGFDRQWLDDFYTLLQAEPAWLTGIVFGPQIRVSLAELRSRTPKRYPIRHYPDITHSLRSQYPVPDWDPAHALTLQREPINPRPADMAAIFRHTNANTIGFITYSEGCNDDVNKIIWSALGWDPDGDVNEALRQYSRYFIGDPFTESFAQGLLALERNWRGPLLPNTGVGTTLSQFQSMDHEASPAVLQNWRFQQAQYRAHYDAYNRARLLYETTLEQIAMDRLRTARRVGSLAAMRDAEVVLDRAVNEGSAAGWRARVFELGEALFQSIRMQLSVEWYKAISVGRGANLDLIDTPLNDRPWLKARFEQIRVIANERERLAAIDGILNWANPGPGGFYDDLGNVSAQPHLIRGKPYNDDPAFLGSPLMSAITRGSEPLRMSWVTYAETLNDSPLRMRYTGLDPAPRYRVRVTYAGENTAATLRLLAEGTEVHPWQRKPNPVAPQEFDLPPHASADGNLTLEWQRTPGLGGGGRGLQVAEVWLLRSAL